MDLVSFFVSHRHEISQDTSWFILLLRCHEFITHSQLLFHYFVQLYLLSILGAFLLWYLTFHFRGFLILFLWQYIKVFNLITYQLYRFVNKGEQIRLPATLFKFPIGLQVIQVFLQHWSVEFTCIQLDFIGLVGQIKVIFFIGAHKG